jgi:hypothetical protein
MRAQRASSKRFTHAGANAPFTHARELPILRLMEKNVLVAAVGLAFVVAGCGGYAVPTDRLIASEAAARSAREVGAANAPQAALHLKLAQEEIAQAKGLMNDGNNKRADYVLIRAKADAELSLALAKEAVAQSAAKKAADALNAPGNQ